MMSRHKASNDTAKTVIDTELEVAKLDQKRREVP